jgi:hypothetical protein
MMPERDANYGIQSMGDGLKIVAVDATALYDPRDASVVHMHRVMIEVSRGHRCRGGGAI